MAADQDAVVYAYQNVSPDWGAYPQRLDAVVYAYQNVGIFGAVAFLGRVVGYMALTKMSNVYVYLNQLEQVSEAIRLMEDGTSRLLEDGTTRILE